MPPIEQLAGMDVDAEAGKGSYRWMPTMELSPGMVVARPVYSGVGRHAPLRLAVGSEITASTIAQLISKGVECIAVMRDDAHDVTTEAAIAAAREARLKEIFGAAPDEDCAALLQALLDEVERGC